MENGLLFWLTGYKNVYVRWKFTEAQINEIQSRLVSLLDLNYEKILFYKLLILKGIFIETHERYLKKTKKSFPLFESFTCAYCCIIY